MSSTNPVKQPILKAGLEASVLSVSDTPAATDSVAELNEKMDKLLELAQAIDWKIWIYLKANNYID